MSEFLENDFKDLSFPVRLKPDVDYREQFAEMKESVTPEFSLKIAPSLDRNIVIRYIAYFYDQKSPFRIKFKDLQTRKVRCMIEAGATMNEEKVFDEDIENIINGKAKNVNEMIIAYLRLTSGVRYRYLVMLENLYAQRERSILSMQSNDKIKDLEALAESLERTQREVLAEDQTKGIVKSLYESINRERLALAPEDIAENIKKKGIENAVS